MSFQVSPSLNENKVFLVKRSELKDRFDPSFYTTEKKTFFSKLHNNSNVVPLKTIILSGSYGILPPGNSYDLLHQVSLLRATDLMPDLEIDFDNAVKVEDKYFAHKRARLRNKDILIAVKGATIASKKCIAYIEIAPEKTILNGSIFHFQVKSHINPKFIAYMLDLELTKRQMKYNLVANNAIDYLDKPLIYGLLVFVPPDEEQNRIIGKMDKAYADKKRKNAEALRLLDSIDHYLLDELGIKLPELERNTIQNRVFYRKFSEISGGRFDAPVHHKKVSLDSSIFPNMQLKDCVLINPRTSFNGFPSITEASFLPMENVSEIFAEANVCQTKTINDSFGYTNFIEDDLVWAKITPCMQNGKSAVVSGLINKIGFGSTEFHVFRAKPGIEIRYIHALLRLKYLRSFAVLFFSGSAGHQRVSEDFFNRLLIPVPPLEKQIEIANRIDSIRNAAKLLKQEAEEEVEQVKKEVEAKILGDNL